jgi:hypothetical protein
MSPIRQTATPARLTRHAQLLSRPHRSAEVVRVGSLGETVTLIGFDQGFAMLDESGVTLYVLENAIEVVDRHGASELDARPVARPRAEQDSAAKEHAFPGAITVANIFGWIAFLVFVGGLFLAGAFALGYECTETTSADCSDESLIRLVGASVIAAGALVSAAFYAAAGFVLMLLDRIEQNVRKRS